jgi:hypothetical protein
MLLGYRVTYDPNMGAVGTAASTGRAYSSLIRPAPCSLGQVAQLSQILNMTLTRRTFTEADAAR